MSGVVVLDVDPRNGGNESLARLQAEHAELPPTVSVRTGDGGLHLYFQHPGEPVRNSNGRLGQGLDVKGDNGMVMAPPSLHWRDTRYEWTEEPSNPANLSPLPEWLLVIVRSTPAAAGGVTYETQTLRTTQDTQAMLRRRGEASAVFSGSLEDAIAATIPCHDQRGQRNRRLFEFARRLRAHPEYADANIRALKGAVRKWHAAALEFIETKDFDDTWADFTYAWPRVKCPWGEGTVAEALRIAGAAPDPPAAGQYAAPSTRLLVRFCEALQQLAGDAPFFLSCRTAGAAVGWDHATALRRLEMLKADGVLTLVEPATRTRAPYFRFNGNSSRSE